MRRAAPVGTFPKTKETLISLKRRDFLKTGFAAGAAMAAAVGTVEAQPKKPDPKKKDEVYDVVVVGAFGMCFRYAMRGERARGGPFRVRFGEERTT